jgi:glycosyltransferase involved in cell wall biosynthesis
MHVATVSVNEPLFEAPQGDDATVLRILGEGLDRLSIVIGVRSDRAPSQLSDSVTLIPVRTHSRVHGLIALERALVDLHRQLRLDVIQAQEPAYTGLASLCAARRVGAALVVGVFGTDPDDPQFTRTSVGHRLAGPVARYVIRRADRVQTDSKVIAERIAARGLPSRYKPMTPLNLEAFLRAGEQRIFRHEGTEVLYVGRLGRQKHLGLLLEAFYLLHRRRPNLRLTIVGAGPDRQALARRVRKFRLEPAVRILGHVAHADLPNVYLAADALALTSRYEGMPRVFLEAGATSLPIVSTPVAGALELQERVPIAISNPDGEAFAEALLCMLDDVDLRRRAGSALHRVVADRLKEPPPPARQLAIWRELAR